MSKAALINSTSIAKARQIDTITPPPGLSYVEESIARCSRLSRQHIPFLRSSPFGSFVNVSGNDLEVSVTKFAKENSITVVRLSISFLCFINQFIIDLIIYITCTLINFCIICAHVTLLLAQCFL